MRTTCFEKVLRARSTYHMLRCCAMCCASSYSWVAAIIDHHHRQRAVESPSAPAARSANASASAPALCPPSSDPCMGVSPCAMCHASCHVQCVMHRDWASWWPWQAMATGTPPPRPRCAKGEAQPMRVLLAPSWALPRVGLASKPSEALRSPPKPSEALRNPRTQSTSSTAPRTGRAPLRSR